MPLNFSVDNGIETTTATKTAREIVAAVNAGKNIVFTAGDGTYGDFSYPLLLTVRPCDTEGTVDVHFWIAGSIDLKDNKPTTIELVCESLDDFPSYGYLNAE